MWAWSHLTEVDEFPVEAPYWYNRSRGFRGSCQRWLRGFHSAHLVLAVLEVSR